jgi:hypothetical protein
MHYDGKDLAPVGPQLGTGHPTVHPDGRHVLTDTYEGEMPGYEDGSSPIRWIDLKENTERILIRIRRRPAYMGPGAALRVDPHPAWDRTYTRFAINACPNGTRRVYIAEIPPEMS